MSKAIKITDNSTEIIPASLDERIEARVRCAMRMINGNISSAALLQKLNNYRELVATYRRYQSDFGAEPYTDALVMYIAYSRLAESRGLLPNGGKKNEELDKPYIWSDIVRPYVGDDCICGQISCVSLYDNTPVCRTCDISEICG